MFYIKVLIIAAVFSKIAQSCPKDFETVTCLCEGQRVLGGGCAPCQDKYFQPEDNHLRHCQVCTICETKTGSSVLEACTRETNTVCKCRENFVPRDTTDSSTCKCNPGFGIRGDECLKCEDGYFSKKRDSPCSKWRQCGSAGVKVNGTNTSDVVCNEEPNGTAKPATKNSTPKEDAALVLPVTAYTSPHKGNQSHKMLTTTTAPSRGNDITQTTNTNPSNRSYYIGVFITFTIVGLIALIVLTLKLFSTPHMERDCEPSKHESLCQPVMEIGDKSCASIKLNPDEP